MPNARLSAALLTSFQRPAATQWLQCCTRAFWLLLSTFMLTAIADRHALSADSGVTFQGTTIKINVGFVKVKHNYRGITIKNFSIDRQF